MYILFVFSITKTVESYSRYFLVNSLFDFLFIYFVIFARPQNATASNEIIEILEQQN